MSKNKQNSKYKTIKVDISDETFLLIAKEAHQKDITFNQRCNEILEEMFDKMEKDLKNERN